MDSITDHSLLLSLKDPGPVLSVLKYLCFIDMKLG
jgi:hypothetical protein